MCHSREVFVTNHVLSGVVIGRALNGRPVTAFAVGVGSHLVLDSVPHWGCDVEVPEGPERFLRVARRDGLLGLAVGIGVSALVGRQFRLSTVAAIAGAVLLDLDKPFDHFFNLRPFPLAIQHLHGRVQNESSSGLPNELVAGVVMAVSDALIISRGRRTAA